MTNTFHFQERRMHANAQRLVRQACRALVATSLALPAWAALAAGPTYYYEGARKISLSAQPELSAEFSTGRSTALSASAQGKAQATQVAGDSTVRIVRVTAAPAGAAAAAGAAASPVFAQGDSTAGRLMALPGGVLVKFKPEWTRAQIDSFVASHGLTISRALPIGTHWFKIDTAPGLASLEAANRLFESGEVLSASPNWWMQTSAK